MDTFVLHGASVPASHPELPRAELELLLRRQLRFGKRNVSRRQLIVHPNESCDYEKRNAD